MHKKIFDSPFDLLAMVLILMILVGCGGHPYFNTWFNLNRHYEQGLRDLKIRMDTSLSDTAWVNDGEKSHWLKVIEKGDKIQKQWPQKKEYDAQVMFRKGMARMYLGEWELCLKQFDEYEANYQAHDSISAAQYHRTTCLEKKGDLAMARFALKNLVQNLVHPYRDQALMKLAKVEGLNGKDSASIEALEKLILTGGEPSVLLGQAHYQLARIYDRMDQFQKARQNYLDTSISMLSNSIKYVAKVRGALMLSQYDSKMQAIKEIVELRSRPEYKDSSISLAFILADLYQKNSQSILFERTLKEVIDQRSRTDDAAHAWYLLGERERTVTLFYNRALNFYDSSANAYPRSTWARWARERMMGIQTILSSRRGLNNPTLNFQASEAYLFLLDQVDSSLKLLKKISEDSTADQNLKMKSTYARAFLYESNKKDTIQSDSLLRSIIQLYPGTEYAKQAQRNLGLEITEKTAEDSAWCYFLKAESLQVSDFKKSNEQLSLLLKKFPQSSIAPKALWVLAMQTKPKDTIVKSYLQQIIEFYPLSNYADYARDLLIQGKNMFEVIKPEKDLLETLERNLRNIREQRVMEDRMNSDRQYAPKDSPVEEELLWDYNDRYGP